MGQLTSINPPPLVAAASLPATAPTGLRVTVIDAPAAPAFLAPVTGGDLFARPAFFDGAAWLFG
jgi:hypothetical protein